MIMRRVAESSPEGNAQGGISRRLLAGMRELGKTKEITKQ